MGIFEYHNGMEDNGIPPTKANQIDVKLTEMQSSRIEAMAKMKEQEYHDSIVERFELACRSLRKNDYQSALDQMYKARNKEYMTKPIRFMRHLKQTRLNEQ